MGYAAINNMILVTMESDLLDEYNEAEETFISMCRQSRLGEISNAQTLHRIGLWSVCMDRGLINATGVNVWD